MENKTKLTFKQCLLLIVVGVVLFVALLNFREVMSIASTLLSYLLPLFVGACLAFAINVPMKAFENTMAYIQRKLHLKERRTLNTYISFFFTLICIASVIAVFVVYAVPQFTASVDDIKENFTGWYDKALGFLEEHNIDTERLKNFDVNNISKLLDYIKGYFKLNTQELIETVVSAGITTFSLVITAVVCVVFAIYMVTGKKKLALQTRKLVYACLPKRFADRVYYIGGLFYKTFYNFITSQCLEAAILSLMLYICFRIFHIPYAGIVSILAGVGNLIPYVGATIAFIIGCLLMLLISPVKLLVFACIWVTIQEIEGKFIYPHLIGNSVGLPALWTLFAAVVGGRMMGLFGIVFFIPLTAVIYILIEESVDKRLKEKNIVVEASSDSAGRENKRLLTEKRRKKLETREKRKNEKEEKRRAKGQEGNANRKEARNLKEEKENFVP